MLADRRRRGHWLVMQTSEADPDWAGSGPLAGILRGKSRVAEAKRAAARAENAQGGPAAIGMRPSHWPKALFADLEGRGAACRA